MSATPEPERAAAVLCSLELASEPRALAAARERVRGQLAARGFGEALVDGVDLVLEELAGNALRYGYEPGAAGRLELRLERGEELLTVTLIDDGRPFDPTRQPPPPRPKSLADAPIGGRGIAMVRAIARAMRYRREGGRNRLEVDLPLDEGEDRAGAGPGS